MASSFAWHLIIHLYFVVVVVVVVVIVVVVVLLSHLQFLGDKLMKTPRFC